MAQGRVYTVQFSAVAITAAMDLFEIVAAAGKPVDILAIEIGQATELGDAQEEQLSLLLKSGQTTSGSGGSTPTPVPLNVTNAAAGFSCEANNTTKASAGTIVTHYTWTWNVRQGFLWVATPEMVVEIAGGRRATLELVGAPTDSVTVSAYMVLREQG